MQNSVEIKNFYAVEFHACRVVLGGHRDSVEVVRDLVKLVQFQACPGHACIRLKGSALLHLPVPETDETLSLTRVS